MDEKSARTPSKAVERGETTLQAADQLRFRCGCTRGGWHIPGHCGRDISFRQEHLSNMDQINTPVINPGAVRCRNAGTENKDMESTK